MLGNSTKTTKFGAKRYLQHFVILVPSLQQDIFSSRLNFMLKVPVWSWFRNVDISSRIGIKLFGRALAPNTSFV